MRTLSSIYWVTNWIRQAAALKEGMMGLKQQESKNLILKEYDLIIRQFPPPNIKLLRNDVLVLYFFDYISHPPLKNNVTVDFNYTFFSNGSFYSLHQNRETPDLSHLVINASKINGTKPISLKFKITAIFKEGNNTKNVEKFFSTLIQVLDQDEPTKANFENYEEGFTLRMRSNDTNFTFPMNYNDIFGNNMNLTIKEINNTLGSKPNVQVEINPLYVTYNANFYRKLDKVTIIKGLGFSTTTNVDIKRRTDLPHKYQLQFYNFSERGLVANIEALTFNDLELTSNMKINSYTHLLTLNSENKTSYLVLILLKMSPKDPLPLSRLFYPDYKLVYYQIGGPMYDASYAWENDKVFWIFKLSKPERLPKNQKEQKIKIFQIFLPDQAMRIIGEFGLGGLKDQLDNKFGYYRNFQNITCTNIEIF